MATNSTLVTNRFLYKSLPYDPDGYAPVGMVGIGPLILLSNDKHGFKSTADVVAQAKQRPGSLTFATFGPGTSSHLRSEEHTSELQSLMRISYAVFCLKKKKNIYKQLRD